MELDFEKLLATRIPQIVFGIIGFLIFIYFGVRSDESTIRGWNGVIRVIKQDEYYGIVTKKYNDRGNHNTPMIVLSTGKEISLYGQQWGLIDRGDCISKKLNTTLIEVFKRDTIITIDQEAYIRELQKNYLERSKVKPR